MKNYGLLGKTLQHSFSPALHHALGNENYVLLEREENELAALFARSDLRGLNVTIPYKKTVLPYCDTISPEAQRIGCVNTIVFEEDGTRHGYNTDYDGFCYLLQRARIDAAGKRAIVLGDGASSLTVETALRDLGAVRCTKLSRKGPHRFAEASDFADAQLLINCTPVGMYPNNGMSAVALSDFPMLEAVVDLIYNPHRSALLLQGMERGLTVADGLPMLVRQAARAHELFFDCAVEEDKTQELIAMLRAKQENLILIGMPGSGKTTTARQLAKALQREWVDIDKVIEEESGKAIPQIFADKGEAEFRRLEKEAIARFGKESNLVIATGGGSVLDRSNYAPLKQNGRIYWLQRPLEELSDQGRPLSQGGLPRIRQLYEERKDKYAAFGDVIINEWNMEAKIDQILEDFNEYIGSERS